MAIFQNLNKQGKTIILVTHELDIANHTKNNLFKRWIDSKRRASKNLLLLKKY